MTKCRVTEELKRHQYDEDKLLEAQELTQATRDEMIRQRLLDIVTDSPEEVLECFTEADARPFLRIQSAIYVALNNESKEESVYANSVLGEEVIKLVKAYLIPTIEGAL